MKEYYRMVIELCKQSLTINRVNPDESLRVLTELDKAITTAKVLNRPTDELCALKHDVELIRAAI